MSFDFTPQDLFARHPVLHQELQAALAAKRRALDEVCKSSKTRRVLPSSDPWLRQAEERLLVAASALRVAAQREGVNLVRMYEAAEARVLSALEQKWAAEARGDALAAEACFIERAREAELRAVVALLAFPRREDAPADLCF